MDSISPHDSRPNIVKRLRRADGHLRRIIEAGRFCFDIAQQRYAVETAIARTNKTLIKVQLDHCTEVVVGPLDGDRWGSIDAFKEIAKYL